MSRANTDVDAPCPQGKPITIGGKTYRIHPLGLRDHAALKAWVAEQFPDPIALVDEAIARGNYTMARQQHMIKTAIEIASRPKPALNSPEAQALLDSPEGLVELFYLSVKRGDPSFTREQAMDAADLTAGQIAMLNETSEVNLMKSDPKDPGPNGTPTNPHSPAPALTGGI